MDPHAYFRALNDEQQRRYALRVNLALSYLRGRVFPLNNGPSRCPPFAVLCRLADASDGMVKRDEVWRFFERHFAPRPSHKPNGRQVAQRARG